VQPIHVDTDQLHAAARETWIAEHQLLEQVLALQAACARLELAWQGLSSEEFSQEMRDLSRQLNLRAAELKELGLKLSREAERWEETDQRWTAAFRDGPKNISP
jgi:uncharacterized protein YukE